MADSMNQRINPDPAYAVHAPGIPCGMDKYPGAHTPTATEEDVTCGLCIRHRETSNG